MDKVKHLELGKEDVVAMNKYFLKMQVDNSNFFYTMDFTKDGQLKNVFWANAKSREAFEEFGDVVTFDTTYLVKLIQHAICSFCWGQPSKTINFARMWINFR